jgi:hypothetical protein
MCDDFDEESINDLDIDKRYLEKQLCEYEKNGYRDALQSESNNEKQIQHYFNYSFKQNTKIGFLIGYLKASIQLNNNYSSFSDNLNNIEQEIINYNYDKLNENDYALIINKFYEDLLKFKHKLEENSSEKVLESLDNLITSLNIK